MEKKEYINYINSLDKNIAYDHLKKRIVIKKKEIDNKFVEKFYSQHVSFLKNNIPPNDVFIYPELKKTQFDTFGKAFIQYPFQIIDQGFKHHDTEWAKKFENIIHITYYNKKIENLREFVIKKISSNNKVEKRFIKKIANGDGHISSVNGWIQIFGIHPQEVYRNYYALGKWKLKNLLLPNYDRLIPLINNMMKEGFDNNKAYSKNVNGIKNLGGLLMYSSVSDKYSFVSGKHRFSSLNYLIDSGKELKETTINFPIVEYPFINWRECFSNKKISL